MWRVLLSAVAVTVLAAACGAPAAEEDPAAVMAAGLRELVPRNNTFGEGHSFTALLVLTSLAPAAGDAGPESSPGRPLTVAERAAIAESLADLGTVQWIDDAESWRTEEGPIIEGSVILGIGEPRFDPKGALAPVWLWCGWVCRVWLTCRMTFQGGVWAVVGTEGDWIIT